MIEDPADRTSKNTEAPAVTRRRVQSRRLFEDCWNPIRKAIEDRLPQALLDTLAPLARSLGDVEGKRVKAVLLRDRAFVQSYLEAVHAELLASIGQFIEAPVADRAAKRTLSLIGHDDSEFEGAVDQCAARVRNSIDDEFNAVKLRLINLLREPDLKDIDSPFRLAVFVRSVAGALRHVGTDEKDVVPLMRVMSTAVSRPVGYAFQAIEERLAKAGAGDALAGWHNSQLSQGAGARGRTARSGPATLAPNAGFENTRAGNEVARSGDAQSALLSLLERLQPGVLHPIGAMVPMMSGLPGAGAAAGDLLPMQASALFAARSPGGGWGVDPALVSAVNDALRLTASAAAVGAAARGAAAPSGAAVEIAELRKGLIDTASRKIDKLTIELVGMVFDRIQRDRHVPGAIKEQLARLQFPLLKVALGDPELFADARQPARQLLDRIASTSIGWSSDGEDNTRYFERVRQSVDVVVDSSADASEAFEQALSGFDAFLDQQRTRDDDPVERARRALAEAENREILAIKATMQVRSAFDGVQLESYLRDFLLDVWVRVLIDASTREKTEPGLVRRYLDAIPDLVWSVQPKLNPGDRKRMIATIPTVLGVLREGLNRIDWPADRIQQFFGKLMNSHASAVKTLELAHGAASQFTASTVRIKLDGFRVPTDTSDVDPAQIKVSDDAVRHVLAASAADVTHLAAPPDAGVSSPAMDHEQAVQSITTWTKGKWFDLRTTEQSERVVLRWISPKRALYLFTNSSGDRSHSLSPDNLVAYLQAGWLTPVETAPLFDRAVDAVLSDLKRGNERTADAGV